MKLNFVDLGKMNYGEALEIQHKAVSLIQQDKLSNTLFFVEHSPVLTLGRRTERKNILATDQMLEDEGVELFDVERGGDVTYHGPGQLVGYPVLRLEEFGKDLHLYVSMLESVIENLLKEEYGIETTSDKGKYTGVYIGSRKITAIGIAVRKWISFHGFAFNVKTNLKHFDWIIPCGLADRSVTSLEKELQEKVDFELVKQMTLKHFSNVFKVDIAEKSIGEILEI